MSDLKRRKPIRMIRAGEIKQHYSMQQAIDAMHRAFSSLSSGDAFVPLRYVSRLPSDELLMLFKPAYEQKEKQVSVKFLTQRDNPSYEGIPSIQGIVLLIDAQSGEILSIMDGEYLTALRTGAASGLATRCFARKDAEIMALFGCGAQGRTQVEAVACERKIQQVLAFDTNELAVAQFMTEMSAKLNVEIVHCRDTSRLKEADIICTATNANAPLFSREVLKEGVHINAVGSFQPQMQELDPAVIKAAKVFVDQLEPCLKESGDFIKAMEAGSIQPDHIIGEIGDFCLNKISGRENDRDITIFKSVGVAIQDYAVASDIYKDSIENAFGQEINLFE